MADQPIRRALLSVWDKAGLVDFARELVGMGVELVSTGGTASALREAGLAVTDVSSVTGAPGILDGRVKTLHPAVHGGILARRDVEAHMATIEALDIPPIDLVVVNLYPFEATVAEGAGYEATVEMIDVGGPAMIRAAAKNHASVTVVVDPQDYGPVLESMRAHEGRTTPQLRQRLAGSAFARTAAYDAAIASWFATRRGELLPERLTIAARRDQLSRYGENPHQRAAFYVTGEAVPGVATAAQVQGKALSFNNIADADAAFELACEFEQPAVAIIKHANPCGVALGDDVAEAYANALACDPTSAYGGIVALNRVLDPALAERIVAVFTEVVIAPDAAAAAREVLAAKPNLRLLLTGGLLTSRPGELRLRSVAGGLLVQERDIGVLDEEQLRVVTARPPTGAEMADLRFAFAVCKHVK
jgi:phosphoribosylaminoimidazolecarboxamide formyltransferase/IMP cyclohydrolase